MGLAVWVEDEAGPYQTVPYPGESWQPESHPARQPHEYMRNGTAKMLTLFHPATGKVKVKGVTQSTNAILHPWLKEQIETILKTTPEKPLWDDETNRKAWQAWQHGLTHRITLAEKLPPLRVLLIWDNLRDHCPQLIRCSRTFFVLGQARALRPSPRQKAPQGGYTQTLQLLKYFGCDVQLAVLDQMLGHPDQIGLQPFCTGVIQASGKYLHRRFDLQSVSFPTLLPSRLAG